MKLEPLSIDSIDYVFKNPWDWIFEENKLRKCVMADTKRHFLQAINMPFSAAVLDSANIACALVALELTGERKWYVHFAATQAGFDRIWISLSLFMLKMSDHLVLDKGGTIQITSAAGPNSKTAEWFDSMGFRHVCCDGNFHHYVKGR